MYWRYNRILQKADLCGCACIEMILKRRDINSYDQEQIAIHTRTPVSDKNKNLFSSKLETSDSEPGKLNINYLNRFLEQFELKAEYIEIKDNLGKLVKNFAENGEFRDSVDVIANYWRTEKQRGHYVLLHQPMIFGSFICDPDPKKPTLYPIPYEALELFMNKNYDKKQRGIIVVSDSQSLSQFLT